MLVRTTGRSTRLVSTTSGAPPPAGRDVRAWRVAHVPYARFLAREARKTRKDRIRRGFARSARFAFPVGEIFARPVVPAALPVYDKAISVRTGKGQMQPQSEAFDAIV